MGMKRMKFRVVLAVIAVTTVGAAGLTACGSSTTDNTASSKAGSAELSGTVTVWDFEYKSFPEYTHAINQIDAEFERQHPAVTINRVAQPYESFEALYKAAFSAHEGPDLMTMQSGASGVLYFKNGLEALNNRITPEMEKSLTQWSSVTPGYTEEGEHYGVPIGLQGYVFYYNKKLFAKAGLPAQFRPTSWEEVIEAGEKLKAAGIQPFVGGDKEGYENAWWFSVGFHTESSPQQARELANEEMPFTDDAISKAYAPMIDTQEAGLYPATRFTTPLFEQGAPSFAEEEGAIFLGLWNTAAYWAEFNPKIGERNVGMFFPPGNPAVATSASFAMAMPKFAQNQEAAWALLEFETSKRGVEVLVNVGGLMSNRRDVSYPAGAPVQERELVTASQKRPTAVEPILMVPSTVAYGAMAKEISEVLQGRTTLKSAQNSMQETAEKSRIE